MRRGGNSEVRPIWQDYEAGRPFMVATSSLDNLESLARSSALFRKGGSFTLSNSATLCMRLSDFFLAPLL